MNAPPNPAHSIGKAKAGEREREREREMSSRLFSSEPRSFKMDRKSPEACNLKESVSKKLFDFLGNYSDDVLAEYIVVLVCNGKHQNQARDDLEAFLGNESGGFVAWLWNHLSKEIYIAKPPLDSSSIRAEMEIGHDDIMNNEHKVGRLVDHQISSPVISDISLSKHGKYELLNFSTNISKTIEEPESIQHWCPSADADFTETDTDRILKQTLASPMNSGAPDYSCSGVTKYLSSRVRFSPESSSGGEHHLHYGNQVQKITRSNSSAVICRPLSVPKTEPIARNLRSIITEDSQSRLLSTINIVKGRLPSAVTDAAPHPFARPRGNVWDRLGKPCKDDAFMRENKYQHDLYILERERLDHNGEGLQKLRPLPAAPDTMLIGETAAFDSCGRAISNNFSDEHIIQDNKFSTVGTLEHADNSKRKRMFGEFSSGDSSASSSGRRENLIQHKEAFPKSQESLPMKNNRLQNLNVFTSEARNSTTLISEPACQPVKSSRTKLNSEADKVPQSQLIKRASVNNSMQKLFPSGKTMPAKSEPLIDAEEGKPNGRPMQDEVLDVKSRLRQVEMDMLKLRSKQAEMCMDTKLNSSSSSAPSGSQNHSEEDIESRTVLVTNVHFAASREPLISHFMQCGVVVKVVLLTDTVTAQPKGAAYVVFASKDSVDKALAMSGTSFLSRTLTVMRKSEMPPGFLVPAQLAGKLPQLWCPQPDNKGSVQRHYTSSHLQWRRGPPATGENSLSVSSTNELGSSSTGE